MANFPLSKVEGNGITNESPIIDGIPNVFDREFPSGTEMCLDPLSGNVLPKALAFMEGIALFDSDNNLSTDAYLSQVMMAASGKLVSVFGLRSDEGISNRIRWYHLVSDNLTATAYKKNQGVGIGYTQHTYALADSYSDFMMGRPLLISKDKWAFLLTTKDDSRYEMIFVTFNELTNEILIEESNDVGSLSLNSGDHGYSDVFLLNDGNIGVFYRGPSDLISLDVYDSVSQLKIINASSTGLLPDSDAFKREGEGYGMSFARSLSDGNILLRGSNFYRVVAFNGTALVGTSIPDLTTTEFEGLQVPIEGDSVIKFSLQISGRLTWEVCTYDPTGQALSKSIYYNVNSDSFVASPERAISNESSGVYPLKDQNKFLLTNNNLNNYYIFAYDPITLLPNTAETFASSYNNTYQIRNWSMDDRGFLLSAGSWGTVSEHSATIMIGSAWTIGNMIENMGPIDIGSLVTNSSTTHEIWVTGDAKIGKDLVPGKLYGSIMALNPEVGVPLRASRSIWERFIPIPIPSGLLPTSDVITNWIGYSDINRQAFNFEGGSGPVVINYEAGPYSNVSVKGVLWGSRDTTSTWSQVVIGEGFIGHVATRVSVTETSTGSTAFEVNDCQVITYLGQLHTGSSTEGRIHAEENRA